MTALMTQRQTVQVLDDAIAFTKAADRAGFTESDFRRACAALGSLPEEQILRICASAREHQLRNTAAVRRHNAKRRGR